MGFENCTERKRPRGTDKNPQRYRACEEMKRNTERKRGKKDPIMGKLQRRKDRGEGWMMERSHNFFLAGLGEQKNLIMKIRAGSQGKGRWEDSVSDDPALGMELEAETLKHSTEVK